MLDDFAFEHPNLNTNDAVRRHGLAVSEVDIGTKRVQRHAAFAVPFSPCDFRAAQTAGDVDTNADRAETQRRLNRTLHRPAERNAALKLLSNAFGDQRRVNFGLADFDHVQVNFRRRQTCKFRTDAFDLLTLLADQNAGTRGMNRYAALLVRTLDDDARDTTLALILHDVGANSAVFMEQAAVLVACCEPAAVPGAVDAEAKANGVDFLTHITWPPWTSSQA